jgi:hypothetical protein
MEAKAAFIIFELLDELGFERVWVGALRPFSRGEGGSRQADGRGTATPNDHPCTWMKRYYGTKQ